MIVFGGLSNKDALKDLWKYSFSKPIDCTKCGRGENVATHHDKRKSSQWKIWVLNCLALLTSTSHSCFVIGSFFYIFGGVDDREHGLTNLRVLNTGMTNH